MINQFIVSHLVGSRYTSTAMKLECVYQNLQLLNEKIVEDSYKIHKGHEIASIAIEDMVSAVIFNAELISTLFKDNDPNLNEDFYKRLHELSKSLTNIDMRKYWGECKQVLQLTYAFLPLLPQELSRLLSLGKEMHDVHNKTTSQEHTQVAMPKPNFFSQNIPPPFIDSAAAAASSRPNSFPRPMSRAEGE